MNILESILKYETQKVIQVNSKGIGILYRVIQLFIIAYILFWVLLKNKGYQVFDQAVSGVTAKVKGVSTSGSSRDPRRSVIFDAADYVIPPQQNSALFIITKLISVPEQEIKRCRFSHLQPQNKCDSFNNSCAVGNHETKIQTGHCVKSPSEPESGVCETLQWCSKEGSKIEVFELTSAPKFTIMLKNSIEFPNFGVKRRNILPWMDKNFLITCSYNRTNLKSRYCPIFKVEDILHYAGVNGDSIYTHGGKISIQIKWSCDLDLDEEKCVPEYKFSNLEENRGRLDNGLGVHFSHNYMDGGKHKRSLVHAYGIQFFITVYGEGGKFDLRMLSMSIGSGMALLAIANLVCDIVVFCLSQRQLLECESKFAEPEFYCLYSLSNDIQIDDLMYDNNYCF